MATKDRTSLKNDFANGKYATGEKFADLIDSMKVVQLPVVDPQALGTSLSFIDSISQDADGKITATKKTLDLSNAHELNPFKGWYKTGDPLPTDGFDGAYLYFKDTSELTGQTTIYRWNGTTYADTGTVVDTSNVNTFETGQAVSGVAIDNSGLANPAGNALAKATDVMPLAVKLEGVTASEDKQSISPISGYKVSDGTNASSSGLASTTNNKYCVIEVNGYSSARFKGIALRSELAEGDDAKIGYDFGFYENGTFKRLLYYNYDRNTSNVHVRKEYNVEIPNGATHLRITCTYSNVLTDSNFYCYLRKGVNAATKDEVAALTVKVQNLTGQETPVKAIFSGESQNVFQGAVLTQSSDLSALPRIYTGFGDRTYYIVIDVEDAQFLRFVGLVSPSISFGYAFFDATNKENGVFKTDNTGYIAYGTYDIDPNIEASAAKEYYIEVPDGAKYFKTQVVYDSAIENFYCYKISGSIAAPIDSVKILEKAVGTYNGENQEKIYFKNPRGRAYINENGEYIASAISFATQYYIPVEGAKCIEMNNATFSSSSSSTCFAFYSDKNEDSLLQIGTFDVTTVATTKHYKIDIPDGAKYFRTTIIARAMNSDAVCRYDGVHVIYPEKTLSDEVNGIGSHIDRIQNTIHIRPFFYNGNMDVEGNYVKDDKTVISGIIEAGKGFFLRVFDEYEIHSAHLVTLGGELVCYNFRPTTDEHIGHVVETPQIYSTFAIPAQFGIQVVVNRIDGRNIDKNDCIVKEFNYLDDETKFTRVQSNGYEPIHYRLNQVMKLYGKFLAPLADGNVNPNAKTQYFNQLALTPSVTYSDVFLTNNFVGLSISFLTYMTALMNPYSVMYTEHVNNKRSHYGLDYSDSEWVGAIRSFGLSCYSVINYLFGFTSHMQVKDLPAILGNTNARQIDITAFDEAWFNSLQVFDCISDPMHVVIITDIIEIDGVRKYVVVSEFSGFGGYSTVYDKEALIQRFTQYITPDSQYYNPGSSLGNTTWTVDLTKIIRYLGLSNIGMPTETPFIQQNQNNFEIPIETSHDIFTFYGDYAAFLKDGDIWLNVRRNNYYNKVRIVGPNNDVTDIDISSTARDTYYYDNDDDWISVQLTTANGISVAGKYTAVAIKETNNIVESSSIPTHFEVISIDSLTANVVNNTVSYSAVISGGDCVSVRCEKKNGRYYTASIKIFNEPNTGSIEGTTNTATGYGYLKLIVKGDYGAVAKRIEMVS